MARIDSILNIVLQQNADELRIGTNVAPRMLAAGVPKKLALPATPDEMMRHLLGGLLTPEREAQLASFARVEFGYDAGELGVFSVALTRRAAEAGDTVPFAFDAVFVKGARKATPREHAPAHIMAPSAAAPLSNERPIASERAPSPMPESARAHRLASYDDDLVALLGAAVGLRASDVHLLMGQTAVARVDGKITPLGERPVNTTLLFASFVNDVVEARLADGRSADLGFDIEGLGRFRMNLYRASSGLAAAIRILPRLAPTLADLRLPMPLHELTDLPHGLVIVCGPTGSGKSTTLAALANEVLRKRSAIVITLEDPIEFVLDARGLRGIVRQREIGRDVRDFPTGLRDALREDPDVLVIGEMRDPETISLALTAAETGHLVLTSLHSRSAASAVDRIIDSYVPERHAQIRAQLADGLRAVVAQRLVPRAHGDGRVAPLEVMRVNHNVAGIIREGKTAQLATAIQSARREGMIPLERCLADLCKVGEISLHDARAVANDLAALTSYMQ